MPALVCVVLSVNRADRGPRLAVHTGDRRDGRRVRIAVVGHRVGRDRDRRVALLMVSVIVVAAMLL